MSFTSSSSSTTEDIHSRNELIQKILHQGQKLRNSMVQSILDHDPFNTEVFTDSFSNRLVTSRIRKRVPSHCGSLDDNNLYIEKRKIEAFLKGESMNPRDKVEALETLRSMSSEDLCRTTNEVYHSNCSCWTCLKYDKGDLTCDLQRMKKKQLKKDENINKTEDFSKLSIDNETTKYLKYVDSLQITIHDLVLNDKGNKKVHSYLTEDKKIPACGSQTFFIEYELPFILSVSTSMKKSKKVLSTNNNFVRICARRISTEAVSFKHTSMHNINNVDQISLGGIKIKFQITCRTMKQKNITRIGNALFDLGRMILSPTLTCIEELPIVFDDSVPIVLGKLRVTLQMGYGRLYFGNEFIACLKSAHENSQISKINEDQSSDKELNQLEPEKQKTASQSAIVPKLTEREKIVEFEKIVQDKSDLKQHSTSKTKIVLFGFLYIPEAQYTKADITSFITCKPFCQEENCYSELVTNESNPIFNFSQLVPLIYDENLLQLFRDNFIVVEFWEKFETENILLGLAKLPLNQFYLAYRNADITKYLLNNKLPVISSDWWVSITNPYTDECIGQAQILLALGSEHQIHNLQLDRGFKTHSVQAIFLNPLKKNTQTITKQKGELAREKTIENKKEIQPRLREKINFKGCTTLKKKPEKSTKDQCIQFDSEMDSELPSKEKEVTSNEKFEQILHHLIAMRNQQEDGLKERNTSKADENQAGTRESVTNEKKTDSLCKGQNHSAMIPEARHTFSSCSNMEYDDMSPHLRATYNSMVRSNEQYKNMSPLVRSTSDLLNSLQAALSVPPPMTHPTPPPPSTEKSAQQVNVNRIPKRIPNSFKVQIAINQALHLPIRKKCKAKRNKGKTVKMDENVKPSSYVTFETMPGLDLKMTPLVQKSSNPEWNYKSDVILPADLLLNNKKRLIFKVWRKSTNTNMVPNLQTDSIIGFAAVDLTVLLSGLPNIKGWFNIIDLSSKCNGQIDIHITPLEDLAIFKGQAKSSNNFVPPILNPEDNKNESEADVLNLNDEPPHDMNHEEGGDGEILGRALKRKFAELDEITQRLRLRLSNVTNEETDDENDEFAEQFEKDINTLSIEEDFDMVNFEHEVPNRTQITDLLKIECSSESSSEPASNHNALCISTEEGFVDNDVEESLSILDKQLLIGKQRIDTLLGKLSLISGDPNTSRYISGCSGSNADESTGPIDTEAILKDLSRNSRPNIHASTSYDKNMFQQIYEYPDNAEETDGILSSNTSVISNLEGSRPAPDGEGTYSEDRSRLKK